MARACAVLGGAGLLVVAAGAVSAWAVLRDGMSARSEPSRLEARLARAVRGWAIPGEARRAANPVPASPQAVAAGLAHYADHCASCHAADGSGRTELGQGLYPRAPDLRGGETQSLTDGELFHIIEHGVRLTGMPAWGRPGSAEASWELVHFLRRLPELSPRERARIDALLPRSPDAWREREEEDAFLRGERDAPRAREEGGHSH